MGGAYGGRFHGAPGGRLLDDRRRRRPGTLLLVNFSKYA